MEFYPYVCGDGSCMNSSVGGACQWTPASPTWEVRAASGSPPSRPGRARRPLRRQHAHDGAAWGCLVLPAVAPHMLVPARKHAWH